MTNTSEELRIRKGVDRGEPFKIEFNGQRITAYQGETIATALLAAGYKVFRHSIITGNPRGVFCGMGLCFDCVVTVNGKENVRACSTFAKPGDVVERI